MTRSSFLNGQTALVSLGASVPGIFARGVVAASNEGSAPNKTLVILQLAGGVDGLNTVVPHKDPAYRDARPQMALAEQSLLPVNDRAAFHPALSKFKDLFDSGKVAIVEGVGYPNPTFSHFKAMDIWQAADPQGSLENGWLGRYFDGLTDLQGHPLAGASVGSRLPKAFYADNATVAAIANEQTFGLQPAFGANDNADRTASLLKMYDLYRPANMPYAALLDTTLDNAQTASAHLQKAAAAYKPAVQYPQTPLASGFRILAELIDSSVPETGLRVGQVTVPGFDTHTNQPSRLEALLTDTSNALSAFWADIVGHGQADDVLVLAWSEFGRRVKENAQQGTDHGSAGLMFLLGGQVKGGFYGAPPSLHDLDDGNLRFTTDFRSVYATVLERWLGAPSDAILGKRFDQLDFLPT